MNAGLSLNKKLRDFGSYKVRKLNQELMNFTNDSCFEWNSESTSQTKSAAFYYWQQVLLDVKNETDSPESRKFKEWMPKLFSDFTWENFVEKYQELRLINSKKI